MWSGRRSPLGVAGGVGRLAYAGSVGEGELGSGVEWLEGSNVERIVRSCGHI